MKPVQKFALGVAGITSLGIGAFILAAPYAFYASYGIKLGPDPSLLSELRAPGAGLATFGAVMQAGIVRPALRQAAVVAALTVFSPSLRGAWWALQWTACRRAASSAALVLELVIAGFCLFAFRRDADPAVTGFATR